MQIIELLLGNVVFPSLNMRDVYTHHHIQQKFTPIDRICTSDSQDIKANLTQMVTKYLETHGMINKTLAVVTECRNNPKFTNASLKSLAFACLPTDRGLQIDLKQPDVVVYLSVFKSATGMSMLDGYYQHAKFNVHQVTRKASAIQTSQ